MYPKSPPGDKRNGQTKGLEPKWHIPHLGVLGFMSFLNSSEHHLTKSKVAFN